MKRGDVYTLRSRHLMYIFVVDFTHESVVNGVTGVCYNNHKRVRNIDRFRIIGWARQSYQMKDILAGWYKLEGYTYTWILDT